MSVARSRSVPPLAAAVWTGGLAPLPMISWQWSRGALGANPVNEALNQLGLLAFLSLLASLACTPAQRAFGWTWPARVRRHLGLLGFTYATLHFTTWAVVDQGLDLSTIVGDVAKRPFVTVGFITWLLLIPLAWTSTAAAVRRLGFVRWKRLHRLVYLCAVLAVVHFTWKQKRDITQPLVYAGVLAVLLSSRLRRRATPPRP